MLNVDGVVWVDCDEPIFADAPLFEDEKNVRGRKTVGRRQQMFRDCLSRQERAGASSIWTSSLNTCLAAWCFGRVVIVDLKIVYCINDDDEK